MLFSMSRQATSVRTGVKCTLDPSQSTVALKLSSEKQRRVTLGNPYKLIFASSLGMGVAVLPACRQHYNYGRIAG